MLRVAEMFVSGGWAAAIVMRRGYGRSGTVWAESYGSCADPDYYTAAKAGADDLRAALRHLSKRGDIDADKVVGFGWSAGGFATLALTNDPPPGLVAAISLAGGRGSLAPDTICRHDKLIAAFGALGRNSRIPTLWIYSANDHFFSASIATKFVDAFRAGGGKATFVPLPPLGADGHQLLTQEAANEWLPSVASFLSRNNLDSFAPLAMLSSTNATVPLQLNEQGKEAFEDYMKSPAHKSFAISPRGDFGWTHSQPVTDSAIRQALKNCELAAHDACAIHSIDGQNSDVRR